MQNDLLTEPRRGTAHADRVVVIIARVAILLFFGFALYGQSPKLLLTSQRLRRLERERERQTERWLNFERRVQSVPDSPERGFELALYYAVTQRPEQGTAAIKWALTHACERRQATLVLDWTGHLASDNERTSILGQNCPQQAGSWQRLRDQFFVQVESGVDASLAPSLPGSHMPAAWDLYGMIEYLDAFRSTQFTDPRQDEPSFFAQLPAEYLLSLNPEELAHPSWQQHVTALALVALDTNLPESQFLQGWAVQDRNTVREGPGVAYELLWGNPYLPGVSYQNREPWVYAKSPGALWARSDWSSSGCWIHIAEGQVEQRNCPAGWERSPATFGSLNLLPLTSGCEQLPAAASSGRAVLIRAAHPGVDITFTVDGKRHAAETDAAGLWLVPNDVSGKICVARSRPEF